MKINAYFFHVSVHLSFFLRHIVFKIIYFLFFVFFFCAASEILVLGTGSRVERLNPSVLALLKRKRIALEVQDTVKITQSFYDRLKKKKDFTSINVLKYIFLKCLFLNFNNCIALLQPNACATFNFLNSERRLVAAGLIPPSYSRALEVKQDESGDSK